MERLPSYVHTHLPRAEWMCGSKVRLNVIPKTRIQAAVIHCQLRDVYMMLIERVN